MGRAKQILVVLLVAVLMCLSACGQAGDNSKKQTDSNDAQTGNYVTLKAITLGQLRKMEWTNFMRSWMP